MRSSKPPSAAVTNSLAALVTLTLSKVGGTTWPKAGAEASVPKSPIAATTTAEFTALLLDGMLCSFLGSQNFKSLSEEPRRQPASQAHTLPLRRLSSNQNFARILTLHTCG